MWKSRILALIVLVVGLGIGSFDYASQSATSRWLNFPFKLGLDLSGGTHLVYEADTTRISDLDIPDAMTSLRGVIERRVNLYGVSEPIVQVEGALSGGENARLIVELPGVTDIDAAIKLIDKTPNLEFKTERPESPEKDAIVAAYEAAQEVIDAGGTVDVEKNPLLKEDPRYVSTALTGRYLKRARGEALPRHDGGECGEEHCHLLRRCAHFGADG
ncbi:MAG: Preprotein translocase subunit SecD [Parcubacteria group bacterium GW2011_GWC1_51_35]|nr:MAG: Preprotein translocase subunit SecD [Parcubacteria group bacterium GW2011_GWC1_51_35]